MVSATGVNGVSGVAGLDFEAVVERYQKKVYGLTFRMTGNHADADCVTQETFLKAYKYFHKFRGEAGMGTWLFRIASNACMDYLRKRGRHEGILEDGKTGEAAEEAGPHEDAAASERRDAVRRALDGLDPQDRMIMTLVSMEGMSHRETAEILGIPAGTVSWKHSALKADLAEKLSMFLEEE